MVPKEYNDNICLEVTDKGTPFLDDDPDDYLKFYVGTISAFPKEDKEFNYAN